MVKIKLIDTLSKILLIFIICVILFFVFIKNTLTNPNTLDIQIISGLILLFILTKVAKFFIKKRI